MNIHVKILQLHPAMKIPVRSTDGSAAYDLFTVGAGIIHPGEIEDVPVGFATEFSPDFVAYVKQRHGVGSAGIVHVGSGIIDSDYRGGWVCKLMNHSKRPFKYAVGERLVQVMFLPVVSATFLESGTLSDSARGTGGGYSTGR